MRPFWKGRAARATIRRWSRSSRPTCKDVAQYYHANAQKTKKPEDYAAAAHWYRAYLSSFPGDPDSAATNYLLADALFESKQYADAATEYEHTAYDYPQQRALGRGRPTRRWWPIRSTRTSLPAEARAAAHQRATDAGAEIRADLSRAPRERRWCSRARRRTCMPPAISRRPRRPRRLLLARTPRGRPAKQRIAWTIVGQVELQPGRLRRRPRAPSRTRWRSRPPNDPERADITERLAAAVYKQGEAQAQRGRPGGRGRGFPARGARGARLEGDRHRAVRCRRRADQRRSSGTTRSRCWRPIGATIPRASTPPTSAASSRWPMSRPAAPATRLPNSSASPANPTRTPRWCARH